MCVQGCVLAPTLFSTCMDHVLGRMSEKSGCGVSFGTVPITDLAFADDAVIFAETPDVFAGTPDSLSEKAEPLGLRFAGRRCVALPILVQMDEGPSLSLAGPPGLAVFF